MAEQHRIVVFSGDLTYSVRKGIVSIDNAVPGLTWLVVLHRPRKTPGRLLRSQWQNLRRNGWRWIPYQIADIWHRLVGPKVPSPGAHLPGADYALAAMDSRPNLRVLRVDDIHAPASIDAVRTFAPDLGLSLAAPILRRSLFSIPRLGTINLHKGKLPDYRGMPPAFWEMWNDEQSVGCTVHVVDDKLDTGDVLRQSSITRAPHSTLRGLQLQLDDLGVVLTREAVLDLLTGSPTRLPQGGGGRTYRKPTLGQWAALQRKLGREPAAASSTIARIVKEAAAALAFGCWQAGLGRLVAPRITVLLYHRVSDDVRDNLTTSIEQFDRQMALLRRHCEPISIEQALDSRVVPRSTRPLVAVTFDDGYLDNYANAAPILMRHGIPAAFFVSTGIVAKNGRFPHDLRRGNPPIPVMTWDQLREMRSWGFTIGSHTVNHIDCAAEAEDTVRAELAQSREDLRRELGVARPLFAYPYGGRANMTTERLELVKRAGYSGCLSAYGGTNVAAVDPYNVLRRGIHRGFTDRAFMLECLGLR